VFLVFSRRGFAAQKANQPFKGDPVLHGCGQFICVLLAEEMMSLEQVEVIFATAPDSTATSDKLGFHYSESMTVSFTPLR
jgi:hypothetical protein